LHAELASDSGFERLPGYDYEQKPYESPEDTVEALRIGNGMTLVAMGLRFDDEANCVGLYAVCDKMLSNDDSSTHLPYTKVLRVGSSWLLGYAGDPSYFIPAAEELEELDPDSQSHEVLAEKTKEIYVKYRLKEIEEGLLAPIGFSWDKFHTSGRAILGEDKFGVLLDSVKRWQTQLQFILGGWEPGKNYVGHLYRFSHPGTYRNNRIMGFSAIGIGETIAMGHLAACYDRHCPSAEIALARLLEAKIMAEAQRNVGPESALLKLDSDGKLYEVDETALERFRKRWETRRKTIPKSLVDALKKCDAREQL
jgi:hypothetical protein